MLRGPLFDVLRRFDARNPRIVGDLARGDDAETLELLIERDLVSTRWDLLECIHETQRLLDAIVHFHDATALRLLASDQLARLEAEAVPL